MMVKRVKMFADSQLFYFGVASSLINIRIYSMSIISIICRDPANTWNGRGFVGMLITLQIARRVPLFPLGKI